MGDDPMTFGAAGIWGPRQEVAGAGWAGKWGPACARQLGAVTRMLPVQKQERPRWRCPQQPGSSSDKGPVALQSEKASHLGERVRPSLSASLRGCLSRTCTAVAGSVSPRLFLAALRLYLL